MKPPKGMDSSHYLARGRVEQHDTECENARTLIGDGHRTAVVTSDYHLARARVLMERGGLDACGILRRRLSRAVGGGAVPGVLFDFGLMLTGRWA